MRSPILLNIRSPILLNMRSPILLNIRQVVVAIEMARDIVLLECPTHSVDVKRSDTKAMVSLDLADESAVAALSYDVALLMNHDYIIGHNYIGHKHTSHNYVGHIYIGRAYF